MGHVVNRLVPVSVLLCLAILTAQRSFVWRSPERLWGDAVAKSPLRPRPHFNLGTALEARGRMAEALTEYQAAEVLSLRDGTPLPERQMIALLAPMNIAHILIETGRIEDGHQVLKQAWMRNPGFPGYAVNLSWFYLKAHEPDKAAMFLADGIAHFYNYAWFPKKGSLYVNLGLALQMMGRCDDAKEVYMVARRYPETFQEPACS